MSGQGRKTAWVCVAAVAAANGLRGAFKLRCFTERPEDVAAYGPVYDKDGRRLFELTVIGPARGGVIAKGDGIDDRDAAEALRGLELFVPRSALPDLAADEFYYEDLAGLTAFDIQGRRVGVVKQVANYGAGDLLEIAGDDGQTLILPFDKATVPSVDLDRGQLVIEPQTEVVAEPAS